jgi:hypothetical protein
MDDKMIWEELWKFAVERIILPHIILQTTRILG